jgi:hypothetical protein
LTQRFDASSRAGSAHRPKSKPFHDARNDFPILMLADEDVCARSPIGQRHHELASVPKGDNDAFALSVQPVNVLLAARFDPHRPAQCTNRCGTDRWKDGELEPPFNACAPACSVLDLITHHSSPVTSFTFGTSWNWRA